MDANCLHSIRHTKVVQVKQGKLVGSIKEGAFGSTYQAFLGIPYATPPLGPLRFKDPQPLANWEGYRVVTDEVDIMSAQICRDSVKNVIGSEDCLYLNVYVPFDKYSQSIYKAVMVWFHGGDFCQGTGDFSAIRPDYLMKRDVILVTVNYRLGILGFLNLDHEDASGNQGLKDQVTALQWLKENIHAFGGNPDNITIFGNGAGAISAHLLMLSPLSKGLFKKAILQSGVGLCNWAVKRKQNEGFVIASTMGCPSTEPKIVAEFLRKLPCRVLVMAEYNMFTKKERNIRKVIFGPTVDATSSQSFLPWPVSDLLNNGNGIPIMIGHNTDEILEAYQQPTKEESFKDEDLKTYVELFAGSHNSHKVPKYMKQILNHYGYKASFHTWHPSLTKLCLSDLYYNLPIRSVVTHRTKQQAITYCYLFSYDGNELKAEERAAEPPGVSHGDELTYMFYMPRQRDRNLFAMTRKDYDMVNMVTLIWSNFAKTGDPNFYCKHGYSQWSPVTSADEIEYFEINRQPTGWINERKHLVLIDKWY